MYKSNCIQFLCFSPKAKNFLEFSFTLKEIVSRRNFPNNLLQKILKPTYVLTCFPLQQVKPN